MKEITMPTFQTPYFRKKSAKEIFSQKYCVEVGTYQDPKKQIEAFIMAGQRLGEARSEVYDLEPGEDDDGRDIASRSLNYDFVDAQHDIEAIIERAEAKQLEKQPEKQPEKQENGSEVSEKEDTSEQKK